ncbi:MAG: O-antigen ligase family protein [Bacteroidetes bacterium]|nr:O-antigen ligase family protein [Bacteroidota bacterium]
MFFCTFDQSFTSVRLVFPVLLWILILSSGQKLKKFVSDIKSSAAFLLLLSVFIIYHGLTLLYTHNFVYGQSKFYGILVNIILNIFALRFLLVNFSLSLLKKLVTIILFSGLLLTIVSASSGPFISFYDEYSQMKIFGIGLYSHVGFGRYMGFVFLVSIINLIYFDFLKKFQIDKIFFLISFAGLILSGLRGAIVSSLLITACIIIYALIKKKISFVKILSFLSAGIILLAAIVYFNNSFSILFERFTQVFNIFHVQQLTDGAIQTRMHIYRTAYEIFSQNIIFGRGLGSFYDESIFIYTKGLKYPHNIFIEYAIELGITGLVFICTLLIYIYRSVLKVNLLLVFLFLYFLLLALFSYSIPFQTGLFSFIAFISLKEENLKMLKNIFINKV